MYSIFCACGVIFVICVVPETKGRDLDSIAKLFTKNSNKSSTSLSAVQCNQSNSNNKSIVHSTEVQLSPSNTKLRINDKSEVTRL